MPATWPADLPRCFIPDTLSTGIADNRLRTQNDTGPGKVRPRATSATRPLSGQMVMTYAQITALEDFVETTLVQGSLPFTFPSQVKGTTILVRFADNLPTWTWIGSARMMVNLTLEVLP